MGILADKLGIRKIFTLGVIFFTITYSGFAFATETWMCYVLFFIYGLYAASTEGIAKAWITNLADIRHTATAIGFYTSFESVCTLLASLIAGVIWTGYGAGATFLLTALASVVTIAYLNLARVSHRST